mmetsp:Transcript_9071/g.19991  ORF Transcript_9071/g.19991 Transcript_9071/m.19991 type:complete len:171 (-) Transcript_9071:1174-1686(-)
MADRARSSGRAHARGEDLDGENQGGSLPVAKKARAPAIFQVRISVLPPVFKETEKGKEFFVASSAEVISEVTVESNMSLMALRTAIVSEYLNNHREGGVDLGLGKLFFSSDSRTLKMELLGGGNKLIESFGRVRNSTKQLRFALGAPSSSRVNARKIVVGCTSTPVRHRS